MANKLPAGFSVVKLPSGWFYYDPSNNLNGPWSTKAFATSLALIDASGPSGYAKRKAIAEASQGTIHLTGSGPLARASARKGAKAGPAKARKPAKASQGKPVNLVQRARSQWPVGTRVMFAPGIMGAVRYAKAGYPKLRPGAAGVLVAAPGKKSPFSSRRDAVCDFGVLRVKWQSGKSFVVPDATLQLAEA